MHTNSGQDGAYRLSGNNMNFSMFKVIIVDIF